MVFRFDRETLPGFVNPQGYLLPSGLELLSTAGSVSVLPYPEVKSVCFVREFGTGEARKEMRVFTTRPKMDGLWVRMHFRDGDIMDGILTNNLLLVEPYGFTIVPPDSGNQNQRTFVPKSSLVDMHVLGVVGSGRSRKRVAPKEQMDIFGQLAEAAKVDK
jgi:hypothetical protein